MCHAASWCTTSIMREIGTIAYLLEPRPAQRPAQTPPRRPTRTAQRYTRVAPLVPQPAFPFVGTRLRHHPRCRPAPLLQAPPHHRHLRSVGCAQRGVETLASHTQVLVLVPYGRATVENCIYLYCECDFDAALGTYGAISRTECEIDANRSFECENDTLSA